MMTPSERKALAARQARREAIYQALCRRYKVKPEPSDCTQVYPDYLRQFRKFCHPVKS